MTSYKHILESFESTVVAESNAKYDVIKEYQSEADLENDLIAQLQSQGYEYLSIHSEEELIKNLRVQLEKLNDYKFSDSDWNLFFKREIANDNTGIIDKSRTIQEDYIKSFRDETGLTKNIYLLNKKNIHENYLQVLNQYEVTGESVTGEKRENRYDVTILVNGLPLVHIELKRRGVHIKEAFNQINRYARESFWSGSGLFEYVQIFVISNGSTTKYYSNTTRDSHIKDSKGKAGVKKTSNSFEFTSFWAYESNKRIEDLREFTATFLSKHTLVSILTKYCIFTSDNILMVMRPYQIAACEKIVNRVQISLNQKWQGSIKAGGYIWHSTGSGKTLTSFKTARIAEQLDGVDKVLFVVDRQDLDYQTMKEYEKFEKGAVDGSKNTRELEKNINDASKRILVTTIQKLSHFIKKNSKHDIYQKNVVFIFDECHRSQFGEMHTDIIAKFKKYMLFGFTGTPIFAINANTSSKNPNLKTTEQAFGDKLHTYTVVDAIKDENVLKFRVDYVNTLKPRVDASDKEVQAIDIEKAVHDPQRVSNIVSYVLNNFDNKTLRNKTYDLKDKRVRGFNSMMAVSSISALKLYYEEFQKQMKDLPSDKKLKIGTIYSFGQNDEVGGIEQFPDEDFDAESLPLSDRDFLSNAIKDYNDMFNTNYDTSSDKFQNYYKDLSMRIKERELDLVIVVNMFLTGFDATTLNTLWVDKNLRMHGLIQAFSRTNRILNSVKAYGNIVCFRNLEENTDEAIALFGDSEASGVVLLKSYDDYYYGYQDDNGKDNTGYKELIDKIQSVFPLPIQSDIYGETQEKEFIKIFGGILKLKNILTSFEQFEGSEILQPGEIQEYQSYYLDLHDRYRKVEGNKESINDDLVFEMELVKSVEINIDYILMLIAQYKEDNMSDKEITGKISSAIESSPQLRNKKDLIEEFIHKINTEADITDEWKKHIEEAREKELDIIIKDENLKPDETRRFIERSFKNGEVKEIGQDIINILPPTPLFGGGNTQAVKKKKVLDRLLEFFERFFGI